MSPENESKNRVSDFIKSISKIGNASSVPHSREEKFMTKDTSRNGLYYIKKFFESVNKRQYLQYFSTFTDAMFLEVSTRSHSTYKCDTVVPTLLDERTENRRSPLLEAAYL